jgi:hypothetical protein
MPALLGGHRPRLERIIDERVADEESEEHGRFPGMLRTDLEPNWLYRMM